MKISGISDEDAAIYRQICEWAAGLDPRVENYKRRVEQQQRLERIRAELIKELGEADELTVYGVALDEAEREALERELGLARSREAAPQPCGAPPAHPRGRPDVYQ